MTLWLELRSQLFLFAELIKRTRDGNEMVRKTAYVALTEKVGLKGFSIQRRISLLKNGFQVELLCISDLQM